jgi:hypothetical protein
VVYQALPFGSVRAGPLIGAGRQPSEIVACAQRILIQLTTTPDGTVGLMELAPAATERSA